MRRVLWMAAGGFSIGGGLLLSFPRSDGFPHEVHAGLFPSCVGCHAGVRTGGTTTTVSITAEECAACHDGVDLKRVQWRPSAPPPTNLVFSHVEHVAGMEAEGETPAQCERCHVPAGAESRMEVTRAAPATCFGCHAPTIEGHFAYEQDCTTCHATLSQASALPIDRVGRFPQPPDHERADFVFQHGDKARAEGKDCAVCHARESCERCHLNAEHLPSIAALERDSRVVTLVAGIPGEWPEPTSHDRPDWGWAHGEQARAEIEECATCHARPSCAACHAAGSIRLVDRLPEPRRGGPQGVLLADVRPAGHTADFAMNHATAASVGMPDCADCHTEKQCADCHDAARKPGFHPVDFVLRHGPDAFGNETECAACHSGEAFCRDCHMASGFAAGGRTGGAFHDAVPDWLLAHGRAARQDLEACTTCHAQSTCLRCHSAKSGFRISPHGPGFDAEAAADRSQQACGICHFSLPVVP